MSEFIEISYLIGPDSTVMEEGLKLPSVAARSRIAEGRHSNTSYLDLFAHTGTHIDAPWHFIETGRKIEDFSIEEFVFTNVVLIEVPLLENSPVSLEALEVHEDSIRGADCLLIYSGFSNHRKSHPQLYIHRTPGLSVEAAEYLSSFDRLRCVGVDFISIENVQNGRKIGFPVHHILLGRQTPMILLEDADLAKLRTKKPFRLFLFPIRMKGLEASPVTAVVEVIQD